MSKKLLRDLKKIACNAGINVKKMVTHRTRTGWAGKGKGLLQCLWERGFINPEKLDCTNSKASMMIAISFPSSH